MKDSRINLVVRLQRWMDSVPGQTFLNYAYSWGAAVVILGTLFKLTHLPGANLMLFLGMGTEVVVFFLSAFDRPFDKSEVELTEEHDFYADDEVHPEETEETAEAAETTEGQQPVIGGGVIGGGGVIMGGGGMAGGEAAALTGGVAGGGGGRTIIIGGGGGSGATSEEAAASTQVSVAAEAAQVQVDNAPALEDALKNYTEKLNLLSETLERVTKQSEHLTTDSEEMTNLNRTLTGINTVYELQLKTISKQIGSIDRINEQTRHMAEQIEELNAIYARMIKALTVNMKNAAGQAPSEM